MTFQDREDYNTPQYKAWRYNILAREKWTCGLCGNKKDLEVHHIKKYSEYPELRYVPSNGIALCKGCHDMVTGREEQYEDQFRRIIGLKQITQDAKNRRGRPKKDPTLKNGKFKYRPRNPYLRY